MHSLHVMSFVSFVTQEFVWTACEGADRSTSGGWTQKTTHTWAWRSPLPPKSLVSTALSLIHCLPPPLPLSLLCQANMQVKLVKLFVLCLDSWRFIVQKCLRYMGIIPVRAERWQVYEQTGRSSTLIYILFHSHAFCRDKSFQCLHFTHTNWSSIH